MCSTRSRRDLQCVERVLSPDCPTRPRVEYHVYEGRLRGGRGGPIRRHPLNALKHAEIAI